MNGAAMSSGEVLLDVEVRTSEQMEQLGAQVAGWLSAGDVLLLNGPLGAGKTTFTRGLGAALGVRGAVTSPTFVIARVHPGPLPLVHVDAYRLASSAELDDLNLEHELAGAVTVIEWGGGVAEGLASRRLEIAIERSVGDDAISQGADNDVDDHDPRRVIITAVGGFVPVAASEASRQGSGRDDV